VVGKRWWWWWWWWCLWQWWWRWYWPVAYKDAWTRITFTHSSGRLPSILAVLLFHLHQSPPSPPPGTGYSTACCLWVIADEGFSKIPLGVCNWVCIGCVYVHVNSKQVLYSRCLCNVNGVSRAVKVFCVRTIWCTYFTEICRQAALVLPQKGRFCNLQTNWSTN
jgi:hypothetical protein